MEPREPGDDQDELDSIINEIDKTDKEEARERGWMDYAGALALLGNPGDRYPTGLPALDEKLEGGLLRGRLIVFQGKPGIGKTMLATQVALELGKKCAVAAFFADEGIEGAAVRMGQQLGVARDRMIAGDGRQEAAEILTGTHPFFRLLNPALDTSTLEFAYESFDELAPKELTRVFLLDSAQVIRAAGSDEAQRRDAVRALMVAARDLTLKYQAITLMVSQVSRGAYRSKKEDERIDPLAAGLESSGIEFMADAIFHLDGNPTKTEPAVKLRCPKNRLSMNGTFSIDLIMDFPRARFLETDMAVLEHDKAVAHGREMDAKLVPVLRELDLYPNGATRATLQDELGIRKDDLLEVLEYGVGHKKIYKSRREAEGKPVSLYHRVTS